MTDKQEWVAYVKGRHINAPEHIVKRGSYKLCTERLMEEAQFFDDRRSLFPDAMPISSELRAQLLIGEHEWSTEGYGFTFGVRRA